MTPELSSAAPSGAHPGELKACVPAPLSKGLAEASGFRGQRLPPRPCPQAASEPRICPLGSCQGPLSALGWPHFPRLPAHPPAPKAAPREGEGASGSLSTELPCPLPCGHRVGMEGWDGGRKVGRAGG